MSSGFHRLGANAGKVVGWSNMRNPVRVDAVMLAAAEAAVPAQGPQELDYAGEPLSVGETRDDQDHFTAEWAATEVARQQGYTGDQCSHCNSMRMQMAGHCMVCADCGETTGCS